MTTRMATLRIMADGTCLARRHSANYPRILCDGWLTLLRGSGSTGARMNRTPLACRRSTRHHLTSVTTAVRFTVTTATLSPA